MARINVDDEFFTDPRLEALSVGWGRDRAIGAVILLWRLGQMHWRRGRGLIPLHLFQMLPLAAELEAVRFVEVRAEGAYCHGAEERWTFLDPDQQANAGRRSAESRKRKYGTALPVNATNRSSQQSGDNSPNGIRTPPNDRRTESEPYSSPSSSPSLFSLSASEVIQRTHSKRRGENTLDPPPDEQPRHGASPPSPSQGASPPAAVAKARKASATGATWEAYAEAYTLRYGSPPVRNAMVNGQLANLVARLGAADAPAVAQFYLTHSDHFYVRKMHPVGLLVADAEKLATELRTGKRMTNQEAKAMDQQDAARAQLARLKAP